MTIHYNTRNHLQRFLSNKGASKVGIRRFLILINSSFTDKNTLAKFTTPKLVNAITYKPKQCWIIPAAYAGVPLDLLRADSKNPKYANDPRLELRQYALSVAVVDLTLRKLKLNNT